MDKVIIAIDSFKGCLSSREAGLAAKTGIQSVFTKCNTQVISIADGGEGLLATFYENIKGEKIKVNIHGPLMEKLETEYYLIENRKTAIIESANACGIHLVPKEKRNPMNTTSYGLGELIKDAAQKGCKHLIIGLGGSSTNDAGMGMLQALGFQLYDKKDNKLKYGGKFLNQLSRIDDSHSLPELRHMQITIACDVKNPFCGPQGAAYIFAAQKGADSKMIEILDKGMQLAGQVMERASHCSFLKYPGSGAAGGLGGCMKAFLNAELKNGIDLILDTINFDTLISGSDLIITGEGKADQQTLMGKVPYGILNRARKQNIPVILIAGSISDREELSSAGFSGVFSITPSPTSLESAMQPTKTSKNITLLIRQLCILIKNIYK